MLSVSCTLAGNCAAGVLRRAAVSCASAGQLRGGRVQRAPVHGAAVLEGSTARTDLCRWNTAERPPGSARRFISRWLSVRRQWEGGGSVHRGDLGGSMDGTRIRLLGPADLLRDGVPDDVPGRSLRTLLAILSLRIDQVVSRDQLVAALWPGRAPATAVNTLQRHLSSLRRLLSGVATISARPPGYVLSPVPATTADVTDVRVAERLVAKSRQSLEPVEQAVLLRKALALWRGDALGGAVDSAYLCGQWSGRPGCGLRRSAVYSGPGSRRVTVPIWLGSLRTCSPVRPTTRQARGGSSLSSWNLRAKTLLAFARSRRRVMSASGWWPWPGRPGCRAVP